MPSAVQWGVVGGTAAIYFTDNWYVLDAGGDQVISPYHFFLKYSFLLKKVKGLGGWGCGDV